MIDSDMDGRSWREEAQEYLRDQLKEIVDTTRESETIMQVAVLRATSEVLKGLLTVTDSQVARLEAKTTPRRVEKIVLE